MLSNLSRKALHRPDAGGAASKGLVQTSLLPQGAGGLGQASLAGAVLLHLGASGLLFAPWPQGAGGPEIYPVAFVVEGPRATPPEQDRIASLVQGLDDLPPGAPEGSDSEVSESEPAPGPEVPPPKPVRRIELPSSEEAFAPAVANPLQIAQEQSYLARVTSRLETAKRASSLLSAPQASGQLTLGFVISADGQVAASWLAEGSGNPLLDRAALTLLQRTSPFDPLPDSLGKPQLVVRQSLTLGPQ